MSILNPIWDKVKNIPTQPCCGYFLHGGTRIVGLLDFGLTLFSLVLIGSEMYQSYGRLNKLYEDLEYLKYYFRVASWACYLTYKLVLLGLSVLLFKAAKKRSSKLCRTWIVMSIVTNVALFLTLYVNHYMFGVSLIVHIFVVFYAVYKLYCLHVVWSFVKEIESYGGFNAALSGLTDAEVEEFERGCPPDRAIQDQAVAVQTEAFNRDFEILPENLDIDETCLLGSGAFGSVYRGKFTNDSGTIPVAVKTVNQNADVAYFKTLLTELKVMTFVGQHRNVVGLLGACTANIKQKKLYMVVEFCPYGNLHEYLKARRGLYVNFVKDGEIRSEQSGKFGYSNINPATTVTTLDLLKWSYESCCGLELLEQKKVVHGDIAARNVLIGPDKVAKISDFGLARKLYQYTTVVKEEVLLPWRWMALESLIDMEFSLKSDVWSFATTLWEVFSLSELPFPGFNWDKDFISKLHNGLRMKQPRNATNEMYELMLKSWRPDPLDRPTFVEIRDELKSMLEDTIALTSSDNQSGTFKDQSELNEDVIEMYVALPIQDDLADGLEAEQLEGEEQV